MFNIGVQELIVIFVVALLVLGPERLPEVGRQLAKAVTEFRRALEEVKREMELEELEEVKEVKKELERVRDEVKP